jgi:anti-sigma regulatory factor (Ser/Thr protein kinase)
MPLKERIAIDLPPTLQAPETARQALIRACSRWPPAVLAVAELLISELVTNAVLHGQGEIGVRVCENGDLLRVEVSDAHPDPAVPSMPSGEPESGRGLAIIAALSTAWGTSARAGMPGKTVWFELVRSPAARPGAPV